MRQLVHSLYGDNNLVPFDLWWRQILLKSEKVWKCFVKIVCRSLFFNKVSRLQAKERLLHSHFSVSVTKYFRTPFLKKTSEWLLLLNTFFCSLRRHQPQKMFSTLVILNIFETNIVNCLWKLFVDSCWGRRQKLSCD